jgi:ATP-binding cassette subfamily B multidrug efflux pump
MGKPIAIQDKADAKTLAVDHGRIQFKDVNFAYTDRNVLDHFNLDIKAGEKIGIVGRSGAGKSTLIQLLLHFYRVNDGKVLIDGQNIQDVTQDSLRKNIALVTQDTSLQASDFIPQLVDMKGRKGLDAYVGERGVKLSGGQRQRIAIARVFLKDAPILILDEATSALDSEVEAAIQESLEHLMEGKTVIAIAHRLSTIAKMDRLIVLDQGRIIEQGSHDELIHQNGLYAQLWARQSGGFINLDEHQDDDHENVDEKTNASI